MANLTKIILGLNILAAGAGIFFGITKSGKTSELMDSVATAKGEASKATSNLSTLQTEKANVDTALTEKTRDHDAMKAERDQLMGTAGNKDTEIVNFQREIETLKAEKASWTTQRLNLQAEADKGVIAQTKLAGVNAEVKKLEKEVEDLKKKIAGPEKPPRVPPLTPGGKVGQIANVDPKYGFLLLNRGSAHGFKVGDQYNVFRKNTLIGRIEVTRLNPQNPESSIAQRTEGLGVPAGAQFEAEDHLVKIQ